MFKLNKSAETFDSLFTCRGIFWLKVYERGNSGKSYQKGKHIKQAMRNRFAFGQFSLRFRAGSH